MTKVAIETRTLNLYEPKDDFKSNVDIITVRAFLAMAGIEAKQRKHFKELSETPEGKHFILGEFGAILERKSTLRKHATLVAGVTPILRFIYSTENVDYEWYPQNPLERAKLDQFLAWHEVHKDDRGFFSQADLVLFDKYFIGETNLFLAGFEEMTIADLVAFFAIVPTNKAWLQEPQQKEALPRLTKWLQNLLDNEDLVAYLNEVKSETGSVRPRLLAKL